MKFWRMTGWEVFASLREVNVSMKSRSMLMLALEVQSSVDPILLAFGIIAHVGIAQRRQFPGGIL
jgi:hypothetical protein